MHIMHVVMNHGARLGGFPEEVARIAEEASVYAKLKIAFPEIEWAPCVESAIPASGLGRGALLRCAGMLEDSIAAEIMGACGRLPRGRTAPSDNALRKGLQSLGFLPIRCSHPTCRDPAAILTALAADERAVLLEATRPRASRGLSMSL